uniref:Uncharacterized protein n=1 Tax=Arundo donax TaxID=35708 RepID=A0A0A9EHS4_ARUDO
MLPVRRRGRGWGLLLDGVVADLRCRRRGLVGFRLHWFVRWG